MFFTQEDYLKIEKWLKARAVKDSQFPELTDYDQPNSDDYFVILQGNKTNAKVKVTKAFLHIYNGLQNRPILRGSGNYSLITDSKWTTRPNEASGEGSIAIGLGNNKASKYLSVAIGQNNIVDSQFSWGLGSDNNIRSVDGYNKVFGNNNNINKGSRNYIIGDNNNLEYSNYNYVFGLNNYISSSNSSAIIIGSNNSGIDGGSSIYIGKGLEGTANDGIASINLGQYNINVPGNKYLFTIGNGKDGNRSNALSIGYDGDINIQNIGSKTLQAYIKDLETSKQNKLIAGAGIEISSDNTISCILDTTIFVVVDTLPLVPEDTNINKIHLVKDTTVSGNLYSEYLYVNNTWEKLGDFQPSIDLSNFVDLTSEQTIIAEKTFSAGINLNNTRIRNVKAPTANDDAANKQYVDDFAATKQDVLTAGKGIVIDDNNTISINFDPDIFKVVSVLPEAPAEGDEKKIHLVPSEDAESGNAYNEYIYVDGSWEKIGSFRPSIDLTDYAKTADIPVEKGTGDNSIVQKGGSNSASGTYSSAFGFNTKSNGNASHTEGISTIAQNAFEHAEGRGNLSIKDKTVHTVGIGSLDGRDRKNAEEIHRSGDKYVIGIGGYDGTNSQTEGVKTVQEVVEEVANAVQITYAELKSLRDAGKLVPGTQYRITDYQCTTTQANTKSAGHQFDIIVTADDENTLNEVARAIKHASDTYFANSDLSSWKIWYCLDNDTNRFAWADATNGKGVIYRMIDEFNNDVPYDFKNIQFYRKWNADKSLWSTISSDNTGVPCYTFSSLGNSATTSFTDYSLASSNNVYSNVIKKYVNDNKQTLNNICFFGNDCYSNTFGDGCTFNTFGSGCFSNTFGNNCQYNTFGYYCQSNTFENNCRYNTFGSVCSRNTFGNNFYRNTFGNNFHSNTFGSVFQFNTFGSDCNSNTFGNYCFDNTFGNECESNTFGNTCRYNTFGNNCDNNTFGNTCRYNTFGNYFQNNALGNNCYGNAFGRDCYNNTLGNNCYDNAVGNYCGSNTFGNYCNFIKFATDSSVSTKYNYYQYNHFGDGCQYIVLKGTETASDSQQVQNYNFAQGLQGTDSVYLTIDGVRNRSFETKVAKNSNGELKTYCEADLIL